MSTRIKSCANVVTHDNYATAVGVVTKTLPSQCTGIFIENMDNTDNVLVSFDGGTHFKTILPLKSLSIDVDFSGAPTYKVKSSANTPNAQCLYTSEN